MLTVDFRFAAAAALMACACSSKSSNLPPSACAGVAPPVALAGPAQSVRKHAAVQLSGAATGAQGEVTYTWRLEAVPPGSAAALSSVSAASPTFTADLSGTYVAQLIVHDACAASTATSVISAVNRAPSASAGTDKHVMPGDTVVLDGSASSDPDQDGLSYQWSFLSRPPGSSATLASATAQKAQFVPDVYGTWLVLLQVSDGEAASAPVLVTVQAGITGPNANCVPAAAPVASAGPDQSLQFGSTQLDGSGSTTGRAAPLAYKWTVTGQPDGSHVTLDTTNSPVKPFFSADRPGVYQVSLVVNDGCVSSAPASVKLTKPNLQPYANAYGPFQAVPILVRFTLQANVFDPDGDPLTVQWQITAAPSGSTAALSSTTSLQPTFTPDLAGSYSFSLVASDGVSSTPPSNITVTVVNQPPVAVVGSDQAAGSGAVVALDGTGSTDPSHRALSYSWVLTAQPAGSAAALTGANTARPTLTPDLVGVYTAQLTVTAGGLSSQAKSTVAVWPGVARLNHRVVDAAYSTALDKLVMAAADPNALYLYDARTLAETPVALSATPSSISISSDGKFAAVGHPNAVSYVDLQNAAVAKVLPVLADVGKVALGDDGFVYAFPRMPANDHVRLLSVPIGAGSQSATFSGMLGPASGRIRRLSGRLYLTSGSYYSGGFEEYALSAGAFSLSTPIANSNSCGDFWFSQNSTRLFTRCGNALHVSSSASDDLTAAGSLAHAAISSLLLHHLDDSTTAGEVSAITSQDSQFFNNTDDRALRRWAADGLTAREVLPLPMTSGFQWNGRFVFYRSDGSERYVILQLDPAAGALHDFGVVIF